MILGGVCESSFARTNAFKVVLFYDSKPTPEIAFLGAPGASPAPFLLLFFPESALPSSVLRFQADSKHCSPRGSCGFSCFPACFAVAFCKRSSRSSCDVFAFSSGDFFFQFRCSVLCSSRGSCGFYCLSCLLCAFMFQNVILGAPGAFCCFECLLRSC